MKHPSFIRPARQDLRPGPEVMPRWKRSMDLAGCAFALPLLLLCVLVMLALTALASPGPVIYKQTRIGHGGRRFTLYKFRTMKMGADPAVHARHVQALIASRAPMEKLDGRGDDRLIPGAWWLRATGLDELPQIINIFYGEMSLVGPRPCLPLEFEAWGTEQRGRYDAVPGLTGLWQVSGKNRTTVDEMLRLDCHYARTIDPRLDLVILLHTPRVLWLQLADAASGGRAVLRRFEARCTVRDHVNQADQAPAGASVTMESQVATPPFVPATALK